MALHIECPACQSPLKVPDRLVGRKVKCPGCGGPVLAAEEPVAVDDRVTAAPRRPAAEEPPRRKAPRQKVTTAPAPAPAGGLESEEAEEPRPRRKKRRRRKQESAGGVPTWVWWVGGAFAAVAATVALFLVGILTGGIKLNAIFILVYLAVMLPVSTVILIISMFVSSWLGGGIEFGEAHVVIPKAFFLLLVINLVGLLTGSSGVGSMGYAVTFPIWLIGLMKLFDLDLWETRFLMAINWVLNFLANYALTMILFHAVTHGAGPGLPVGPGGPGLPGGGEIEKPERPKTLTRQQREDLDAIEKLGGSADYDDELGGKPVVAITLTGQKVKDADLALLKSFPMLRRLDLSGSLVTSAGLDQLAGMPALQTLDLSGTLVTDGGLPKLAALPSLKTVHLSGTNVTDVGVKKLREAKPGLRVLRDAREAEDED
jgi:hypothetical protein